MQLRFSVAARNRTFSKAMRQVRLKIQPLIDAFENISFEHPIHEAILVGITDDKQAGFFEEVKNNDGYFQVMAGCGEHCADNQLTEEVFEILHRAVLLCPFARVDHQRVEDLFSEFRPSLLR